MLRKHDGHAGSADVFLRLRHRDDMEGRASVLSPPRTCVGPQMIDQMSIMELIKDQTDWLVGWLVGSMNYCNR